jgi:transketolase
VRQVFAETLYEEARDNPAIFVVCADISPVGSMQKFREEFPKRFVNVGVAEQSMIGICAGLALRGLRPFAYSMAAFSLYRPYEFVRDDIGGQGLAVTVIGMGAGGYADHGYTHFTGAEIDGVPEDVRVAQTIKNMIVLQPGDIDEVAWMTRWLCRENPGPAYLRLLRLQ